LDFQKNVKNVFSNYGGHQDGLTDKAQREYCITGFLTISCKYGIDSRLQSADHSSSDGLWTDYDPPTDSLCCVFRLWCETEQWRDLVPSPANNQSV